MLPQILNATAALDNDDMPLPGLELSGIASGSAILVSDHCAIAQRELARIDNPGLVFSLREHAAGILGGSVLCALVLSRALASDPDYEEDAFAGIEDVFTGIDGSLCRLVNFDMVTSCSRAECDRRLELARPLVEVGIEIALEGQRQDRNFGVMAEMLWGQAQLFAGVAGDSVSRLVGDRLTPGEQRAEMDISLKAAALSAQLYEVMQTINAGWENAAGEAVNS